MPQKPSLVLIQTGYLTLTLCTSGAVVLELLPYNWEWKGISQVYHNVTTSVGDVHHFAWRAKHPRWAQYMDLDEARYAHWTAEECSSRSPAVQMH